RRLAGGAVELLLVVGAPQFDAAAELFEPRFRLANRLRALAAIRGEPHFPHRALDNSGLEQEPQGGESRVGSVQLCAGHSDKFRCSSASFANIERAASPLEISTRSTWIDSRRPSTSRIE